MGSYKRRLRERIKNKLGKPHLGWFPKFYLVLSSEVSPKELNDKFLLRLNEM